MKILLPLLMILVVIAPVSAAHAFPVEPVDFTTAGFVGMASTGPFDQPVIVNSYPEFTEVFGSYTAALANPYLAPSVAGFFANGGVRLAVVRVSGI